MHYHACPDCRLWLGCDDRCPTPDSRHRFDGVPVGYERQCDNCRRDAEVAEVSRAELAALRAVADRAEDVRTAVYGGRAWLHLVNRLDEALAALEAAKGG